VSDDLIKALVPASDADYYATFGSSNYRYWRLQMTSVGATAPQVGEFYLGTALTLANNPDVGLPGADVPQTFVSRSISGRKIVKKTGRTTRREEMTFTALSAAEWANLNTVHTAQNGNWKPLFYVPWNSGTPTEGPAFFSRIERYDWEDIGFDLYDARLVLEEEQ